MTNSRNQNENDFFINLAVSLGISLIGVTAIGIAASSINYALDRLSQTAQNRQAELWNNKP